MDFLKNAANQFTQGQQQGQHNQNPAHTSGQVPEEQFQQQQQSQGTAGTFAAGSSGGGGGGGGFFDGLKEKMNTAAGGGRESEKDEDYLDKGIDFVQERFMGQGPQDNESAVEQAKDEQISDYIRGQYKNYTGSDMPIKDKPTRFG